MYEKGVIYKLCCKDLNIKEIYVGSTCNFSRRKCQHKSVVSNVDNEEYVYRFIRDNGGWDNWEMILIENYPCSDRQQLLGRERYWYETLEASLNMVYPNRSKKEYYDDNEEKIRGKNKKYYDANREKVLEHCKKYYEQNKQKILKREKIYYGQHRDKRLEQKKKYYEQNKQKKLEREKKYYEQNKQKIIEQKKLYRQWNKALDGLNKIDVS